MKFEETLTKAAKKDAEFMDEIVYKALTETEFNLSEKIVEPLRGMDQFKIKEEDHHIYVKDVKEFIERRDNINQEMWKSIDRLLNVTKKGDLIRDLVDREFILANEKKDKLVGEKLI